MSVEKKLALLVVTIITSGGVALGVLNLRKQAQAANDVDDEDLRKRMVELAHG